MCPAPAIGYPAAGPGRAAIREEQVLEERRRSGSRGEKTWAATT